MLRGYLIFGNYDFDHDHDTSRKLNKLEIIKTALLVHITPR